MRYVGLSLIIVMVISLYMAVVMLTRRDPVRERLKRFLPAHEANGVLEGEVERSDFAIFCGNLLEAIGIDLAAERKAMYLPMARAGFYSPDVVVYFLFFKRFLQPVLIGLGIAMFGYMIISPFSETTDTIRLALVACVVMAIGVNGARIFLNSCTDRHKKVLQQSFPEVLDLMLICVESGLPLDAALSRVCREMKKSYPEIISELERTRTEINVLNDRVQALQNLAERTDIHGFKTLVSALIQTEKIGSSMAETLRMLSSEYRMSRMLHAEGKAARIPTLITIPLIFFIMPAFMLILMGPLVIRIHEQSGFFQQAHFR